MTAAVGTATLTNLWRSRLGSRQVLLLARLRQILLRTFNPADVDASMLMLAPAASQWISAAQAAAHVDTLAYLEAYLTAQTGRRAALLTTPDGLVGVDSTGRPLTTLVEMGGSIFKQRVGLGWDLGVNTTGLLNYLNRIGASEPYRAANNTIGQVITSYPDHWTGRWARVTRSTACDWCRMIHDRGYTSAAALTSRRVDGKTLLGFPAHTNCHCTAEPEAVRSYLPPSQRERDAP